MNYIKEQVNKELLKEWEKITGKKISYFASNAWAVNKEFRSFMSFRTMDREPDSKGLMLVYYYFFYNSQAYRLGLKQIDIVGDNIVIFKAEEVDPLPKLTQDFIESLNNAFTICKQYDDIFPEKKVTNEIFKIAF